MVRVLKRKRRDDRCKRGETDIDIDRHHVVGQKLGVDCRDKVRHIEIKRELSCATTFTLRADPRLA